MKYIYYTFFTLIILAIITIFSLKDNDKFKTTCDFVSIRLGQRQSMEDVENKYLLKVEKSLVDNTFFKANGFPEKVFLFADKTAKTLSLYGEAKGG